MPQPDRAKAEEFDGALVVAALDVFADPEGVVEQIEHAGNDVANEGLGAKADRDAEDAQTGDQRSDLDAQRRQRHHHRKYDDDDEQDVAKDRQQGAQPRPPPRLVGVRLAKIGAFGELAIDRRLHGVPQEIGDEQDDDGAQHAIGEAGEQCLLRVEVGEIDTPAPGEYRNRTEDQGRPDTALDENREHARRRLRQFAANPEVEADARPRGG